MATTQLSQFERLLIALLAITLGGCAHVRLPAIDPSGECVFLPKGQTTTLVNHKETIAACKLQKQLRRQQRQQDALALGVDDDHFTEPAFKGVDDIPPCEDGVILPNGQESPMVACNTYYPDAPRVVVPSRLQDPNFIQYQECPAPPADQPRAEVTLTPRSQIVAVGTEAILIGGVCGTDGYYQMRESLEWMMGEGSVGHFVDPGRPAVGLCGYQGKLSRVFSEPLPELCSNRQAIGVTSRKVQVLTRGTTRPDDDLFVLAGQGWISLTSAVEGDTHVTLTAPDLDDWDRRTNMAVIHWVDGEWTFPEPVVTQSIQAVSLSTSVRRRIGGAPISGWIVRYEILEGAPATFPNNATTAEVRTDPEGKGTVQIAPADSNGGTTQVKIQIIRPGGGSGAPDRLLIAEATTSVTWANSRVDVNITGPQTANFNDTATYNIDVRNPGNVTAAGVLIQKAIPPGFQYLSSNPPAVVTGTRLDWTISQLPPGQHQSFEVTYRVTQSGTAQHCVRAESAGGAPIEECLTTEVSSDALFIEMLGPNENTPLPVGTVADYQLTITNRGNLQLDNVLLVDRFDAGLKHSEGASPIEWPVGSLAPGQSRKLTLSFEIVEPGRHCHTLEATAVGARPARTGACVTAIAEQRPDLTIRKNGPTRMSVGESAPFEVTVQNSGSAPLANLQIIDIFDPELRPLGAEPQQAQIERSRVTWYLPRLDPGQSLTFKVTAQAMFDVTSSCNRVVVRTADGSVERTDQICVQISRQASSNSSLPQVNSIVNNVARLPNAAPTLPQPIERPSTLTTPVKLEEPGELALSIKGRHDHWSVGQPAEYVVTIRNRRELADTDVVLEIETSEHARIESYQGPVSVDTNRDDWRSVKMKPIRTLRTGEVVQFTFLLSVDKPGRVNVKARVTSIQSPDGFTDEASTTAIDRS